MISARFPPGQPLHAWRGATAKHGSPEPVDQGVTLRANEPWSRPRRSSCSARTARSAVAGVAAATVSRVWRSCKRDGRARLRIRLDTNTVALTIHGTRTVPPRRKRQSGRRKARHRGPRSARRPSGRDRPGGHTAFGPSGRFIRQVTAVQLGTCGKSGPGLLLVDRAGDTESRSAFEGTNKPTSVIPTGTWRNGSSLV
jgi:hypothetical protein